MPVDVTDTVALLTPFIKEVDTWPAATHNLTTLPIVVEKVKIGEMDGPSDDLPVPVDKKELPPQALDRSMFLREAKTNPALRHLENAMCDMRYVNILLQIMMPVFML